MSNIVSRVVRKFRAEGVTGVAAAARGRYQRWVGASPVRWARYGRASLWLAQALRPLQPPVLVLSLGRSGSTWVAQMLGEAPDALLLDEPMNRGVIAHGVAYHSQIEAAPAEPPEVYQRQADLAFAGCPTFAYPALRDPKQWSLAQRARRRVVVKEVNPLACEWLVRRYRPRVILLVRHPAAVALSYRKMDWLKGRAISWQAHAVRQARALRAALDSLRDYPEHRVLLYEELCAAPVEHFRRLFDFAGLTWEAQVEKRAQARSAGGDLDDPWGTSRDSLSMIRLWREQIGDEDLWQVREGFGAFDLPWYRSDKDW
jgi:hypothetical protein